MLCTKTELSAMQCNAHKRTNLNKIVDIYVENISFAVSAVCTHCAHSVLSVTDIVSIERRM